MSAEIAETAVRRYLQWLTDPSALRDTDRLADLESELADTADPIDRLKLLSSIERLSKVDGDEVKMGFIRHARDWAVANEVSVGAFRALGVEDVMLEAAGLVERSARRQRSSGATSGGSTAAPAGKTGSRAPMVPIATIIDHVRGIAVPFTLTDVMGAVGGSPATVRKAVEQLVSEGTVRSEGPATNHHARGRAPIVYVVV